MGVDKAVPYAICIMRIGVGIGGEDEEGGADGLERMIVSGLDTVVIGCGRCKGCGSCKRRPKTACCWPSRA